MYNFCVVSRKVHFWLKKNCLGWPSLIERIREERVSLEPLPIQSISEKEKKSLDGTYTRILRTVTNISWKDKVLYDLRLEKVTTTIHIRNRVF